MIIQVTPLKQVIIEDCTELRPKETEVNIDWYIEDSERVKIINMHGQGLNQLYLLGGIINFGTGVYSTKNSNRLVDWKKVTLLFKVQVWIVLYLQQIVLLMW
jgi:hypothetical protein